MKPTVTDNQSTETTSPETKGTETKSTDKKIQRRQLIIGAIAIFGLLLAVAWMGGAFTQKIAPGISTPPTGELTSSNDGEFLITPQSIPLVESVPAAITAKQATLISSRLMARITSINVRSGETVKQGQLIAQLEKSDLQSRANQASEQIRAIEARLLEADNNLQRIQTLFTDGVVSRADLERAQANQQTLSADLAGAKLALEEANTAVSYSEIRAPIDGRVIDRFAEPGDTASPGQPLISLYNPLSLQVEASVRESLAIRLTVGDPVSIEIPSVDKTLDAFVEEIVPAADANSRSFTVKARFQFNASLLPGMYARLLLPIGEEEKILVPRHYIASVGQLDVVWVKQGEHSERRFVKTGQLYGDTIEVIAGLDAGDTLLQPPPQ